MFMQQSGTKKFCLNPYISRFLTLHLLTGSPVHGTSPVLGSGREADTTAKAAGPPDKPKVNINCIKDYGFS